MRAQFAHKRQAKNPLLVLAPTAMAVVLGLLVIVPWMRRVNLTDPLLAALAPGSCFVWLLIFWW